MTWFDNVRKVLEVDNTLMILGDESRPEHKVTLDAIVSEFTPGGISKRILELVEK